VPREVPVLAGTGAPTGGEAVQLTRAAAAAGADAALVLSPAGVTNPNGYYQRVAGGAGDLPLLAYHFPLASPPGIPLELLPGLPVRGVKDSSGDAERLAFLLERYDGDTYVGSPPSWRSRVPSVRRARFWRWRTWSRSAAWRRGHRPSRVPLVEVPVVNPGGVGYVFAS